jgi:hypothetical protein
VETQKGSMGTLSDAEYGISSSPSFHLDEMNVLVAITEESGEDETSSRRTTSLGWGTVGDKTPSPPLSAVVPYQTPNRQSSSRHSAPLTTNDERGDLVGEKDERWQWPGRTGGSGDHGDDDENDDEQDEMDWEGGRSHSSDSLRPSENTVASGAEPKGGKMELPSTPPPPSTFGRRHSRRYTD